MKTHKVCNVGLYSSPIFGANALANSILFRIGGQKHPNVVLHFPYVIVTQPCVEELQSSIARLIFYNIVISVIVHRLPAAITPACPAVSSVAC